MAWYVAFQASTFELFVVVSPIVVRLHFSAKRTHLRPFLSEPVKGWELHTHTSPIVAYLIEDVVAKIVPGNKLNLMIHDGTYLYVHKNEPGTLYEKKENDGIKISTKPLDDGHWTEIPSNCLQVYRDGELVYEGQRHRHTYIHDPEKMKVIYMSYASL